MKIEHVYLLKKAQKNFEYKKKVLDYLFLILLIKFLSKKDKINSLLVKLKYK